MDVVISSEVLEVLLDPKADSIQKANAQKDARMCLETKEEYAIIVWSDEEIKQIIDNRYHVTISDEHAIDILNIIEETNDGEHGVSNNTIRDIYETHIQHHYKED
jgi:hypothetical protein